MGFPDTTAGWKGRFLRGEEEWFLGASGIMPSKLPASLTTGLIFQVEILSTPTVGGSITWYKLSGESFGGI